MIGNQLDGPFALQQRTSRYAGLELSIMQVFGAYL
jgi:hypothetical protein